VLDEYPLFPHQDKSQRRVTLCPFLAPPFLAIFKTGCGLQKVTAAIAMLASIIKAKG
jgi:hypothetical protein